MEFDLSPKLSQTLFEGDGGSYHFWSGTDLPLLKEAEVGAGKLILKPLGFALPHYADCAKIGYVIEGKGMAGLIHPQDPKEKIVTLEQGDFIQVPLGVISWWYNDHNDSDFQIIFLGDTCSSHKPGEFTYFLLAGSLGIFNGFSTEFITKSFKINEEQAKALFKTQTGILIIKLEEKILGLKPCEDNEETNEVEFSCEVVKIDSEEIWGPRFCSELAVQVICVFRGSGRFQIVGCKGDSVLDAQVKEGELLVVPKFYVASAIADGDGMEWFSMTSSPRPVYGYLAGKASVLKAFSPQILGVSLNVNQDLVKILNPDI